MSDPVSRKTNGVSPYLHWYYRLDGDGLSTRADDDTLAKLLPQAFGTDSQIERFQGRGLPRANWLSAKSAADAFNLTLGGKVDEDYPTDIEVIVGVIDTDIPLGHRAFRNEDGTTRVLYHWAMGAMPEGSATKATPRADGATSDAPDVSKLAPEAYGREFTQADINRLLKAHSPQGDLRKPLDQDGFNRAIGALDYDRLNGQRALGTRHSHGAHMLDVAGGCDPRVDETFAQKVGLVTVNMPSRWDFGEGGEFLDRHMINAVLRIYEIVENLRAMRSKDAAKIPAVTSLAFGRQAGAKREDTDILSQFLDELKNGQATDSPPFDLVIPTGNDNLKRVVARYTIQAGEMINVGWRVIPADQTDNYLEIWADPPANGEMSDGVLAVGLIPPDGTTGVRPHVIKPDEYTDVTSDNRHKFASRIYRFEKPPTRSRQLTGYLLALGPVAPRGESLGAAPSGLWTVQLENTSHTAITVHLSVQTDQSVQPVAQASGRSYLDDEAYRRFDSAGRQLDTVKWNDPVWESAEGGEGTRRHGTMNVAASQTLAAVVGGYRISDGKPAIYASSGLGPSGSPERKGPDVALPTDDSAILWGTLAAGSADGSRVAMRGTSFAASKATRFVAEEWLKNKSSRTKPARQVLQDAAKVFEMSPPYRVLFDYKNTSHAPATAKFGTGRVPFETQSAQHRKNG